MDASIFQRSISLSLKVPHKASNHNVSTCWERTHIICSQFLYLAAKEKV